MSNSKWLLAASALLLEAAACPTEGVWEASGDGSVTNDCNAHDPSYEAGEDATRMCWGGSWIAEDYTACVFKQCTASAVFTPAVDVTATRTGDCAAYDSELYTAGDAVAECVLGVDGQTPEWDTPNTSGCDAKECSQDGDWLATDVLTDGSLDCTTYDAVIYTDGTALRACENDSGTPTWAAAINVDGCTAIECAESAPWPATEITDTATIDCTAIDAALYVSGSATRVCENISNVPTWGTPVTASCEAVPLCSGAPWPDTQFGETATIGCEVFDAYSYESGDATRTCDGSAEVPVWSVTDAANCVDLPAGSASQAGQPTYNDPDLDVAAVDMYPGNYYINLVVGDEDRQFHLGHITCPGLSVCVPNWVGNGHCDDCFGCDPFMVASGMFGDCSTCDYFWSGGAIGKGVFDGGDCDDFVFPSAIVEDLFGQCLTSAGFRTEAQLEGVKYRQQRNIIISELVAGGWGNTADIQEQTDMQLVAMCQYANLQQCLVKNGWWNESMASWSEGDLHFEAATWIEDFTTHRSIDLVNMGLDVVLEQCAVSGLHQKIAEFSWIEENTLDGMTADQKRNHVITRLFDAGIGTAPQLQALSNSQIRMILDFFDISSA